MVRGTCKRKAPGDADCQEPDPSSRAKLHDACVKILNRGLEPGDVVYQVRAEQGGQVAELTLRSLPGPCGKRSWTSGVCENRRAARLQAASLALLSVRDDPVLADILDLPSSGSNAAAGGDALRPGGSFPQGSPSPGSAGLLKAEGAAAGSPCDTKTEVVVFCQWSCGRPMGRKDVVYTWRREDGLYVATARLNCFSGDEYVGKPRGDRRQAEQSAAEEVLKAFAKERKVMARAVPKRRRVHVGAAAGGAEPCAKQRLHEACARLLGHPPQAGDVIYEVAAHDGGPAASLRLPCLPGSLGTQVWTSKACRSRRDARAQVAAAALQAILEDPACRAGVLRGEPGLGQ